MFDEKLAPQQSARVVGDTAQPLLLRKLLLAGGSRERRLAATFAVLADVGCGCGCGVGAGVAGGRLRKAGRHVAAGLLGGVGGVRLLAQRWRTRWRRLRATRCAVLPLAALYQPVARRLPTLGGGILGWVLAPISCARRSGVLR